MNRPLACFALLAAVVLSGVVAPAPTEACLMRMKDGSLSVLHHEPIPEPAERAVDLLNAGRNQSAVSTLYREFGPDINGWAVNAQHVDEDQRDVVLIVALATLRSEGAFERSFEASPVDEALRDGNVKWAIRAIENLAFTGELPERHLAEAWARDPALQEHALSKLEDLWNRGQLLSPFQLAQLERLYLLCGRTDEAARARARKEVLQRG